MPKRTAHVVVLMSLVLGTVLGGAPAFARDGSYSPSGTYVADPTEVGFELTDEGYHCPKASAVPKPPAPAVALKNAQAAATKLAGKKAMAVFAKSKAYKSADAIPASVMTGLATGRPNAALAASLRGAVLEPKQPRHLVNAAVILMGYGDLKDANGLLAAAGKIKGTGAALGVTAAQDLAAAKAELDVATGHYTLAEQIYRALTKTDAPLLVAEQGLSQVLACEHKTPLAASRHARGERQMFDYVADGDAGGDSLPPQIDAGSVDESAGKDIASFGTYYRPANQDDATAHLALLQADQAAAVSRAQGFANHFDLGTPAGNRYLGYAALVLTNDKELKRLLDEQATIERDQRALDPPGGDAGSPTCYYSQHHAAMWDFVDRYLTSYAATAHRFHALATALAAGVHDPVINRDLNLQAKYEVATLYEGVLGQAVLLAANESRENIYPECKAATPPQAATGGDTPADTGADSDPCSAAKAERLKIKFGSVVSAEFNCEQGKVEVVPLKYGVDQAYIGAFGEAGVKWKSGDVTVVTGVKVNLGLKDTPGAPEVGLSGKAGFYVTAGRDKSQIIEDSGLKRYGETKDKWEVKDWGVRLQATTELPGLKGGPIVTITKFDSKTHISLVGVFN